MASEEVLFLRDQVQRLNTVLSEYQKQYASFTPSHNASSLADVPSAPWLIDKSLIAPLIAEYEMVFQQLKEENDKYKEEIKNLSQHVDQLVSENKRLTRELKDTVQTKLEEYDVEALQPSTVDDQMLYNFQTQLQLALQEKESAMTMWETATSEVERLEAELAAQRADPSLRKLEQQANMLREQCSITVAELNAEVMKLQDQLRSGANDNKVSQVQIVELRSTLDELKQELVNKDQLITAQQKRQSDLETVLTESQSKLGALKTENAQLKQDLQASEERCTELHKKASNHEQREYEAALQVKDSVQMVENAMLEKDQAVVREQQKGDECQRLQEALNKLIDEAGVKTKQEVEAVKRQCNRNIAKLTEDLENAEVESSQKQAELERAIREKRAAESELEKLYQEGLAAGSKQLGSYDEITNRVCQAERARDEALVKLESLQGTHKRALLSHEQEKNKLQTSVDDLRSKVNKLKQEFDICDEDRVKLNDEVNSLKQQMGALQKERESDRRKFEKEISCLHQDMKVKQLDYDMKSQTAGDEHRHTVTQMRTMLETQQKMSAKWNKECQTITQKFEAKVNSLRSEVTRHKSRNESLQKILEELKSKMVEAEDTISDYAATIERLKKRVNEAETRLSRANKAPNSLTREQALMRDKRQLQKELERSQLGHSRHDNELLTSDLDVKRILNSHVNGDQSRRNSQSSAASEKS